MHEDGRGCLQEVLIAHLAKVYVLLLESGGFDLLHLCDPSLYISVLNSYEFVLDLDMLG